jgi:hypothetical protein
MTRPARIPPEQSSFSGEHARPAVDAANADGRDLQSGVRSDLPDADVNLGTLRRFGDLKHNLTNQWKVQDR